MMIEKTNIRKTFNYLIRAAIILFTYGFIYRQVFVRGKLEDIPGIFERASGQDGFILMMGLILLLMLVNWGLETLKWNLLIAKIESLSFFKAFKAVMTGASVSLFTPNRTGDYLGRVFILEKANHIEGILVTLIGSFAQNIMTVCIGLFCFLSFLGQYLRVPYEIRDYLFNGMIFLVPCLVFFILLIYFKIGLLTDFIQRNMPGKWKKFIRYSRVFERYTGRELLSVLLLSLLRYLVFSTQFFLLLRIFGVALPIEEAMIFIPVIYLFMSMVPSIALTELGIRGSVSIYVIGFYFNNSGTGQADIELAILASASVLWFVNLVIPAILGTFSVFSLKFFRK